jgi:cytochrome c-type protein NapC
MIVSDASLTRQHRASTALFLALVLAPVAHALDWSAAETVDITLFYPGQQSWEKTLTAATHKGAAKIRQGESCGGECHGAEEAEMGASQAEATGFAGRSSVTVQVRAVVTGELLHWQVSGPVAGGEAPAVGIMLGTDALKSTTQAGCWAACHDDAPGMASDRGQKLGKYLAASRSKNTATGGGNSVKPQADLDAALAAGTFLDLIEVKADGAVERGYVLERFHEKNMPERAHVSVSGDRWVTEVSRPLAATAPGEVALQDGKVYYFGIAIHDPGAKHHEHLVSLGYTLAVGSGTADLMAGRQ